MSRLFTAPRFHLTLPGAFLLVTLLRAGLDAAPPVERDRWEIFTRDGVRKGYTQYRTEQLPGGRMRSRQVTVFGKGIELVVAGFYVEWEGSPLEWTAFGFFSEEDYRTRFERRNKSTLVDVVQKDSIWIPTNAYPSQLTQPLIQAMGLTPGSALDYTLLVEGTAQSLGRTRLEVVGREMITLHDLSRTNLIRVNQILDDKPRRIFWVNDEGKVIVSDLNGPRCYLTDSSLYARDGHWDWPTLDTITTQLDR